MGRQHQGVHRPGVRQVPEGSGEQGNMEETGCKIICGAPTTLAVKGKNLDDGDDEQTGRRAETRLTCTVRVSSECSLSWWVGTGQ